MYQDFDNGLARQRTAQMRAEVSRNRLAALLARAARSGGGDGTRRGKVDRGAAPVTVLLR